MNQNNQSWIYAPPTAAEYNGKDLSETLCALVNQCVSDELTAAEATYVLKMAADILTDAAFNRPIASPEVAIQ